MCFSSYSFLLYSFALFIYLYSRVLITVKYSVAIGAVICIFILVIVAKQWIPKCVMAIFNLCLNISTYFLVFKKFKNSFLVVFYIFHALIDLNQRVSFFDFVNQTSFLTICQTSSQTCVPSSIREIFI